MAGSIVSLPTTLAPLPPVLHRGLTAVAVFGFLSFLTSVALFGRLAYRLLTWKRKSQARANQFIILLFNLIFADIQQSIAFLLNVQWLRENAIDVTTSSCWAQGWFVSTGDMASGVFTFVIALHSFMDIVNDYRLGHTAFILTIGACWVFVYACAIIGVALHPGDFYTRAGAWCWVNAKFSNERLWLHYFWVIIAEFGTVIIYLLLVLIIRKRVKESFYTTSDTQLRAQSAAKMIIAYPIVYVVCTLPLVTARLTSMAGGTVTFVELCVAGAMITSNGWLDVLLYTFTRRALLFGSDVPDESTGVLETFRLRPDQAFGVTTTIEASNMTRRPSSKHRRKASSGHLNGNGGPHSRTGSTEELVGMGNIKTQTMVHTVIEPIELEPMSAKGKTSFDTRSEK
ncbi:hypothetical protein LTR97_011240 [Elasticomyces elasticus]|uniref:G protein-coupled receptor GPR1/2/3 C-terminal domain-containing protein n=1 Tax=Elasticomyces elasticus TaxID=574655 RepID=A0AAN7ZL77_9PEZI|nr:hypothetical protein LTR42_011568 [Elasticomyces elasticus]KAK5692067.1 hypothetical protein LTR97_011240 [Elasticomyces elasticus]